MLYFECLCFLFIRLLCIVSKFYYAHPYSCDFFPVVLLCVFVLHCCSSVNFHVLLFQLQIFCLPLHILNFNIRYLICISSFWWFLFYLLSLLFISYSCFELLLLNIFKFYFCTRIAVNFSFLVYWYHIVFCFLIYVVRSKKFIIIFISRLYSWFNCLYIYIFV